MYYSHCPCSRYIFLNYFNEESQFEKAGMGIAIEAAKPEENEEVD